MGMAQCQGQNIKSDTPEEYRGKPMLTRCNQDLFMCPKCNARGCSQDTCTNRAFNWEGACLSCRGIGRRI